MNYVKAFRDGEITERGLRETLNCRTAGELLDIVEQMQGLRKAAEAGQLDFVSLRNYVQAAIVEAAKREEA